MYSSGNKHPLQFNAWRSGYERADYATEGTTISVARNVYRDTITEQQKRFAERQLVPDRAWGEFVPNPRKRSRCFIVSPFSENGVTPHIMECGGVLEYPLKKRARVSLARRSPRSLREFLFKETFGRNISKDNVPILRGRALVNYQKNQKKAQLLNLPIKSSSNDVYYAEDISNSKSYEQFISNDGHIRKQSNVPSRTFDNQSTSDDANFEQDSSDANFEQDYSSDANFEQDSSSKADFEQYSLNANIILQPIELIPPTTPISHQSSEEDDADEINNIPQRNNNGEKEEGQSITQMTKQINEKV